MSADISKTLARFREELTEIIDQGILRISFLYTVTVSFDGFDETGDAIYPTMEQEAEKIEIR